MKLKLSIYLLRPSQVAAFEAKLLSEQSGMLPLADPFEGAFLPASSAGGEPPCVAAVRSVLQTPTLTLVDSQSPAGLMVVRRAGRTFVVNFGHAWMKLDEEWLEKDFGRKVVLNLVARDKVLEIKAEQIFAKGHLASERAPRASSVREFGVEFDRDLVGTIEGLSCSDPEVGNTVRGATSLRVHIPFPDDLLATLDKAAGLFTNTAYQNEWPEINNIRQLTDTAITNELDAALDEDFAAGKALKTITLFTPGHKRGDEPHVDAYVVGRKTKPYVKHPYLTLDAWLAPLTANKEPPSVAAAMDASVHLLDDSENDLGRYSIFDCFGYELTRNNKQYVLSSGIWYDVLPTLIADTTKAVKAIAGPPFLLPAWNQKDSEGVYNAKCDSINGLLTCDLAKIFYGGGMSQFEFCDMFHLRTKTLFFAKIVSKSTGMSHLLEQVRRTAELLFSTDGGYRKEVEKLLKKHHPNVNRTWLQSRPKNGEWNFCLVSLGRKKDALPFFAKRGLVKLARDLNERGHSVSFTTV